MKRAFRFTRRGFSLFELLIALMIGSLVLTLALRLVSALTVAARQVERAGQLAMQQANGIRWLQMHLRAASVPVKDRPFVGTPRTVAFDVAAAKRRSPQSRRRVVVMVEHDTLSALVDGERRVVIRRNVRDLAVDYLVSRGLSSLWLSEWSSDRGLPVALRFRMRKVAPATTIDTVLVTVGVTL